MTTIENDVDLSAADAPKGFTFEENEGQTLLNPIEADQFPPESEQDVGGLLWLGYLTDSFVLFGHEFTIRTLTRGELLSIALITKEWEDSLGMADAFSAATVAAAVQTVDGQPLVPALSSNTAQQERIRAAFDVVQDWYDPIVESVYARYRVLQQRQQNAFLNIQSK